MALSTFSTKQGITKDGDELDQRSYTFHVSNLGDLVGLCDLEIDL